MENNRIRKINKAGKVSTLNVKDELNHPYGVSVAPNGQLYVSDSWNNRILKYRNSSVLF